MEYLDVVNDKNKVIGKELKSLCHKNDLIHRGSGILVFQNTKLNKILLQKRSKKVQDPGLWCSPGGHVRSKESYRSAMLRECQEELFFGKSLPAPFFKTANLKRLFIFNKNQPYDREFIAVFLIVYAGPFFPNKAEVEKLQFFDVSEIEKNLSQQPQIYTYTFQQIFKLYCSAKSSQPTTLR